ncbi:MULTISPECIES: DVUA0089 family protein [Colwellia]|uniref:Ice-binding protein C-terminal domain-containing protein n=1 Tax=Colwellia marinimaniae TaxID=1513592 RepID=A0ABQ0MVV5_9GAMM|nr:MULTISPECIES: DVUA0089 family protein [Colwellia]GAW96503.1 hypothetical protein MTCD1_02119 [Colwellia marinimaniae]
MNIKMIKAAVAGLVLSVSGFANAGLITLDGRIDSGAEVDHWILNVTSSGLFTFDVLAYEGDYDDFFDNGTNNDHLDSYIYLFSNDINGSLVDSNDDGELGNDGSTEDYDSFMSVNLNVGTYVFAIGDYHLNEAGARDGINESNANEISVGNYRVSISSQAGVLSTNSVPEPTTLAIFALGIMGLAARRFKKQ